MSVGERRNDFREQKRYRNEQKIKKGRNCWFVYCFLCFLTIVSGPVKELPMLKLQSTTFFLQGFFLLFVISFCSTLSLFLVNFLSLYTLCYIFLLFLFHLFFVSVFSFVFLFISAQILPTIFFFYLSHFLFRNLPSLSCFIE